MIKAVIFDLDGVLVDSLPYHYQAFKQIFSDRGINYTLEQFKKDVAKGAGAIFKSQLGEACDTNRLKEEKLELMKKMDVRLKPGALKLLQQLKTRGIIIAIASGGARNFVDFITRKHGLDKFCKAILAGEDVSRHKPSPEIFLLTAERLAVKPSGCVVVEDAGDGVHAAKAAGMKCIAFEDEKYCQNLAGADAVIDNLEEAFEIICGE